MKANELMLGDWVFYGKKPVRVLQLTDGKDYKHISPIPLTPEILEKNGFERLSNYQWEYRDNSCEIVISVAPQIEIDGEIIGNPPINIMLEGALVTMDITSDCYVHTLQHINRLCGIDKEIVL